MNWNKLLTNLNPFAKKEKKPNVIEVIDGVEITDEPPAPILGGRKKKEVPEVIKDMKSRTWRLSEQDKQIIVSVFASGLTPTETCDRVREEYNLDITPTLVVQYANSEKWQPLIRKIRQETMNNLSEIAGSHKKVRLSRHERVYEKALKKNDLKNAISATEHQRKEMEGDGAVSLTLNQFNGMTDEELKLKHEEVLKKIERMSKTKGVIDVSSNKNEAVGS